MSSRVNINPQDYLPVIEITKNDNTQYNFNHFLAAYDFRVDKAILEPPIDGVGGSFSITFMSNSATVIDTNTIKSNIAKGNKILFYVGKSDAGKIKKIRGIITDLEVIPIGNNFVKIIASGPDWGSHILNSRKVNGIWIQDKLSDGITPNINDDKTTVKQIVLDLLTKKSSYPVTDYTVEDQGVIIDPALIIVPDIRIAQYEANFETLEDKLSELDDYAGTIHYIDTDYKFHMHLPQTNNPSGVLLVDDYEDATALGWDQTKVGLILFYPEPSLKDSDEERYTRIFGLGGDQLILDQKQETDSNSLTMEANYRAVKFTPKYRILDTIGIIISKIGSPTLDLAVELIEDDGGVPGKNVLRVLNIDKAKISSSAAWQYLSIGEDLNTAKSYWIILRKIGDASNTFKWHYDGTGVSASSADGVSWSTGTTGFAFRTYSMAPVLHAVSDSSYPLSKFFREEVIKKPDITQFQTMSKLLIARSAMLFKAKEIFKCTIIPPDVPLDSGQSITVRAMKSGLQINNETFVLGPTAYLFQSDDESQTGMEYQEITAARYITPT